MIHENQENEHLTSTIVTVLVSIGEHVAGWPGGSPDTVIAGTVIIIRRFPCLT